MRQLWISVAILAGMLLLLWGNMVQINRLTEPLLTCLNQAADAVREGDWQTGEALTGQVQADWQEASAYLRFVQFHGTLDEVTALLGEAEGYLIEEDVGEYLAANRKLAGKLSTIQGLEAVTADNLF